MNDVNFILPTAVQSLNNFLGDQYSYNDFRVMTNK